MVLEARTASLLASGCSGDPTTLAAHDALATATMGGARALGWADQIGSLVAGKLADLVAFDFSGDDLPPIFDPVSHLIYAGGREQVAQVWVHGENVVVKRQILGEAAIDAWAGVRARRRVWHNRVGQSVRMVGP
jgi:5-methylthioadenosine/S-adenosylhomocysteine deaminase